LLACDNKQLDAWRAARDPIQNCARQNAGIAGSDTIGVCHAFMTRWTPVRNLALSADLLWTNLDQKCSGAINLPTVASKPAGLYELKDQIGQANRRSDAKRDRRDSKMPVVQNLANRRFEILDTSGNGA
jgi:hypothetical protein